MVNPVQVLAVNPGVVKSGRGDLGKLAGSDPARRRERVDGRDVALPEAMRGLFFVASEGASVVKEALIIAVPMVRLDRESVASVRSSLVMSLDLDTLSYCSRITRKKKRTTSTYLSLYSAAGLTYSDFRT